MNHQASDGCFGQPPCCHGRSHASCTAPAIDVHRPHDFGTEGFAQITLLLALAVISAGLTASLATSRGASQQAAALERLVETDALTGSAHRRLLAAFDEPRDELELRALAGSVAVALGDKLVALRIESEASKIDLLLADPALIEGYLDEHSLPGGQRERLLANIEDARAQNDPVTATEVMDLNLLDSAGSDGLRRDTTRFGGAGIDPQYASARVLRAVPDLLPGEAERIAALGPGERTEYARVSRFFASGGRAFSLVATVEWSADQSAQRRLPIEISTAGRPIVLAGAY